MNTQAKSYISSLEFYRGIAACSIVALHASRTMKNHYEEWWLTPIFELGKLGVEFFFVLSGFIMLYIHFDYLNTPTRFVKYTTQRITRIFPFYWLVLTFIVLTLWYSGDIPSPLSLIDNYLLLPTDYDHLIIGVAWTLKHEMLFYLLFSLLIVNRTLGAVVFIIWMLSIILVGFQGKTFTFFEVVTSPVNLLFIFGMIAAMIVRYFGKKHLSIYLYLGVLITIIASVTVLTGDLDLQGNTSLLIFGLAFSFIIVGSVTSEKRLKFELIKPLALLGVTSYSIYLTHSIFLPYVFNFLNSVNISIYIIFSMLVFIAILMGILVGIVVEHPTIKWSRHYLQIHKKMEKKPLKMNSSS